MFNLTDLNRDVIKWHGLVLKLNLSFDNVILLFKMFKDKDLKPNIKFQLALEMLILDIELIKQLESTQITELAKYLLSEKLNIDLESEQEETSPEDMLIPFYDYDEDAGRIYASFLIDYNIDLIEQQGKLSWDRFKVLFDNISYETPLGQAKHYRTCEVPAKNAHNADERKRIRKMKEHYKLKCVQHLVEAKELAKYERIMKEKKERLKNNGS